MMADVVEMETEDSTSAIVLARGVVGAPRKELTRGSSQVL